jgi:uncharacterized membrane protein YfcA
LRGKYVLYETIIFINCTRCISSTGFCSILNFYFILIFFVIALLYSSVGFGGGSSYIAFLLLFNVPYEMIPIIALSCNLVVVSGGAFHYIKNKQVEAKLILPFIVTSIPFAYLAGLIQIEKDTFKLVLGAFLLIAGIRMVVRIKRDYSENKIPPFWVSSLLGAFLGFISGLVGIGGGIFLSPIMYNLKWGKPKQISALCCLFIFFNSIAGLAGQLQKTNSFDSASSYWGLILAVFIGGQIGSHLGSNRLKPRYIEILTAVLVIVVALRIFFFS